ncbi:transposase [Heyndrickxia coagulans]|uniref:transposase n=3 Tax=Heyndrickxia coagulans TaxID=1398 RepID=UPI0005A32527|nr:transposase [Heyndrickxia coagulans]AJH77258.1 transposase, Mutator family protein [Heyndrickxia coagulans DSM 1 = ATCC 7050]
MTHLQFNLNLDVLKEAIMTSDLDAVIKSAVVLVLNEFMEKERDDYLKTSPYERAVERRDYRNGYYERELLMSIGNVTLKVPRTRNGEFSTTLGLAERIKFGQIQAKFRLSKYKIVLCKNFKKRTLSLRSRFSMRN